MGEQLDRKDGGTSPEINPGGGKPSGNSGNGKSTGTPSTGGTGGNRTGGTGAAGTGKEKAEPVPVAVVNADNPTVPAPAPAEKKPEKKPKKVNKKKAKTQTLPTEQVDAILVTISSVIAARPKCEHWLISEAEAHSISEPLCNMLAKYEVFEKVGENSDALALAFAAACVILPRAMQTAAIMKEEKKNERTVKQQQTGENRGGSKQLPNGNAEPPKRSPNAARIGSDADFIGSLLG